MLNIFLVLSQTMRLILAYPLGVLGITLLALLATVASLGVLTGAMAVGLAKVFLLLAREGRWQPQELWGKTNRNSLYAGWASIGMLVGYMVLLLAADKYYAGFTEEVGFLAGLLLGLVWFYPFVLMADAGLVWRQALAKNWRLIRKGGVLAHVLLAALLEAIQLLPTDKVNVVVQLMVLVLLFAIPAVAQCVAYASLTREPAKEVS